MVLSFFLSSDSLRPPDKGVGGLVDGANFVAPVSRLYLPYDSRLVEKARENRLRPTEAEKRMWYQVLSQRQFVPYKFLRQKPLDAFIVDFYCAALLLAIEIDGDSHAQQVAYDEARTQRLEEFGIQVIRYTNEDVLQRLDGVAQDFERQIKERAAKMRRLQRPNPLPPYQGA